MTTAAQLKRDFAPFVDPATTLNITEGSHGLRIQLIRNGVDHDYFLTLSDKTVMARHIKGRKYPNVRSLFASNDFADIRALAATQVRLSRDFTAV